MAFSIIFRHILGNGVELHDGINGGHIGQEVDGNRFVFHQ